jgi:hypothetical protein
MQVSVYRESVKSGADISLEKREREALVKILEHYQGATFYDYTREFSKQLLSILR